jgi:hypothetical protein
MSESDIEDIFRPLIGAFLLLSFMIIPVCCVYKYSLKNEEKKKRKIIVRPKDTIRPKDAVRPKDDIP